MKILKGEKVTIEFPVRPQIVNFTGKLFGRGQDFEIEQYEGLQFM